jgi:hypothetical protein
MTACLYTDKEGCMRGCIRNGTIQIWHKKGGLSKKEFCLTISMQDISQAHNDPWAANADYNLRKIADNANNLATERWIESSPSQKLKNVRRGYWEENTLVGRLSCDNSRSVDSIVRVVKGLYNLLNATKEE